VNVHYGDTMFGVLEIGMGAYELWHEMTDMIIGL
jgi:hypothetical protein